MVEVLSYSLFVKLFFRLVISLTKKHERVKDMKEWKVFLDSTEI